MLKSIISFLKKGGIQFFLLSIALILNNRMGYISMIGIFSILVLASLTLRTKLDRGVFVITLYTVFYIVLSSFNGFSYSASTLVLYAVAPLIFYQFGNNMVTRYETENYLIVESQHTLYNLVV